MIVMPANATGWFWHALARETGRLGHLYSPGAQRGPWPWFPYALDNGAFSCWDRTKNAFDDEKWRITEAAWQRLLFWAAAAPRRPMWAIVPDVPGDAQRTLDRWSQLAGTLGDLPIAIAVQDGLEPSHVKALKVQPQVVAVGGTTEWKWATWTKWVQAFPRVHVLRVNAPTKLEELEAGGVESCDGTGWNRGDRKQTAGLEEWARAKANPRIDLLWPYVCREKRNPDQLDFA